MADKTFHCRIITPESRILDAQISYAKVPMWDGKAGFMTNSSAMVGKLGFGELRVDMGSNQSKRWYIDGGFLQNVNNELTILASGAIEADSLDRAEIKAELAEANAHTSSDAAKMDAITARRQKAIAKLSMIGA